MELICTNFRFAHALPEIVGGKGFFYLAGVSGLLMTNRKTSVTEPMSQNVYTVGGDQIYFLAGMKHFLESPKILEQLLRAWKLSRKMSPNKWCTNKCHMFTI